MLWVTIFFTIVLGLLIVLFNWPGKAWKMLRPGDIGFLLTLNQRTETTFTKTWLVHVWWPLQTVLVYSTLPERIDMPAVTLVTGGTHTSEITVNTFGFTMRVTNPIMAYWSAPKHDPEAQLRAVAVSTMTEFTATHDVTEILGQNGIVLLRQEILQFLQTEAGVVGCKVLDFWATDIDLPKGMISATDIVLQAEGEAKARDASSEAEVRAFTRERQTEGTLYYPLQVLDEFREMLVQAAKNGLRVFGGDLSTLVQALMDMGLDKEEKK